MHCPKIFECVERYINRVYPNTIITFCVYGQTREEFANYPPVPAKKLVGWSRRFIDRQSFWRFGRSHSDDPAGGGEL